MKSIGFIPLRKGSKEIKGKNKRKILGRPLFCWVLTEAVFSELDEVFIYSDDEDIITFVEQQYAWTEKIVVVRRPADCAKDTSSTESAIFEFLRNEEYHYDIFCLLQATSPLTKAKNINECLGQIKAGKDSCLSVVKSKKFLWDLSGKSVNYNFLERPRRQEFEGSLVENGAIYCSTKKALLSSGNRISGNIGLVLMPENTLSEIDSREDWVIVEKLLENHLKSQKKSKIITHLFLDVDGVFTDGRVLYSEKGEFAKAFDIRDGMGLEILRQNEIEVRVITSESSPLVAARMKKLNIDKVYLGVKDKFGFLQQIIASENIEASQIAYIGDDVNDMANLCLVGWSFAPKNAMAEIKTIADVNLSLSSGAGAIREACEFITKYNARF